MKSNKEKDTLEQELAFKELASDNGVDENGAELSTVKNPVAVLEPKMQRFVHLYLTGQYTMAKLAQLLEVHPNTITNWMRRDDVKYAIADMQVLTHEVVGTQIKAMTQVALNRMRDLIDSPNDKVAFQATKDILDRAGHRAKQEIKVDKTVHTFEEKLSKLIDDVIEADYEEVD